MTPHRIRLNGFWTATPTADGRVEHARSFGKPRTSDPTETLWVVTESPGEVRVNGASQGDGNEVRIGVELQPRNRLAILTSAGETLGDVAIEIRQS